MASGSHYNISERKLLLKIADVFIILASLLIANYCLDFTYIDFSKPAVYGWGILLIVYYLLFSGIFQSFDLYVSNNRYLTVRNVVMSIFTTTIFYITTPFITPSLPENRLQIVYFFFILLLPVLIWRFVYIRVIFSPKYYKSILLIGSSKKLSKIAKQIKNDNYHQIVGHYSDRAVDGLSTFKDIETSDLSELVYSDITEIIVSRSGLSTDIKDKLNTALIRYFKKGVSIKSYETFYEEINQRVPREYLKSNFYEYFNISINNDSRFYLFVVRSLDVIVSLIGLLLFLLFLPFILIGNLLGNRGGLLYYQTRVGKKGQPFQIYKLRSMVKNAEMGKAIWAQKNDSRITKFGKFLRKTRLDEFPQFINILKGDMSIIGPRPERPEFIKSLEEQIPFYSIRQIIKPGLTGWAQVNYPYASTVEEQETKLRYDLYYIKERNPILDLKILIKTITTVIAFRGQ